MQQLDKRIRNWILKENCGECLGMPQLEKFKTSIRNPKSEKKRKQSSLSLHALFHPFLLTYDTTQWIVNGGLQDSLYKEILTLCWDCKWVPRFLLEDLQAGNFMKNMPWSWFIVLPHQLIHSFRSKWSNNPRSYPTIFRSKFLDPTHEIFRIKTGWLWQQEYLANNYFLWLQAGRRTVRRWKRNPSRLVLRFSRNSTRPAGLRTCRGVLLSPMGWAMKVWEKNPWRWPTVQPVGFVGSFFLEILGHPQRWPPQFLEDLEIG